MPGDRSLIAHLFRRAGFSARPADLDYYVKAGYQAAVDDLLSAKPISGGSPSVDQTLDPVNRLLANLRGRAQPIAPQALQEIQTTWVERMMTTTAPLVERMTLFFHNHFATAYRPGQTVDTPELTTQNNLFRDHAVGNFRDLCHALIEDVAMSCWLNNNVNVKAHPNENLAREFFELFTLGPGNYTETDIRMSARALTGYYLADNSQGTDPAGEATGPRYVMVFDPARHDDGVKNVLGTTGKLMPHDIVDIALSQPAASRFIAGKLAQTFVRPDLPTDFIERIAVELRNGNWALAPVLRMIFTSPEFAAARSAVVKTPTEFMIGVLRALNRNSSDDFAVALYWMSQMGQVIYDPPNVGGWPSNMGWLGAGGVLARYNTGVSFADRHVNSTVFPGQTRLRATTPQGWGEIFGLTELAPATVDAMNGYTGSSPAGTTDQTVDAAMITLVLASPDYSLA